MKSAREILLGLYKRSEQISEGLRVAIEKEDELQAERNKAKLDEIEKIIAYIKAGDGK